MSMGIRLGAAPLKAMVPVMLPVVAGSMGVPGDAVEEVVEFCSAEGVELWLQPGTKLNSKKNAISFSR
jgi:hypothetical protein